MNCLRAVVMTALVLAPAAGVAADVRQGPALLTPRAWPTATLLPDGRVWLAGGLSISPFQVYASTELYDPRTELLTAGPPLVVGRHFHSGVLLRDGTVLLLGGKSSGSTREASTERFLTATGQVVAGPPMKSSGSGRPPRCWKTGGCWWWGTSTAPRTG